MVNKLFCSRKSLPYHYFADFSLVTRKLRAEFRVHTIPPWFCCNDLSVILSLFGFTDLYGNLMEAKRNPSGSVPICPQNIGREWILITPFGTLQLPYFTFYLCYFLVPPVLTHPGLQETEEMLTNTARVSLFSCKGEEVVNAFYLKSYFSRNVITT